MITKYVPEFDPDLYGGEPDDTDPEEELATVLYPVVIRCGLLDGFCGSPTCWICERVKYS